ncbi:hypothetical protein L596_028653 [Steinernema carpocapsae]|uniref:Uncharacterized protein n=1 Tax=Steinernema carpocapsae TaxID=34508 RepID=A0A4U5LZ27_STECR|nr:hypothetical protein L596_028653 [Steinernema carpocapsae]
MTKYDDFVYSEKVDGHVTKVPGIGDTYGGKLARNGYNNAPKVFGRFLMCDENRGDFESFLKRFGGVDAGRGRIAFSGFLEWADRHLGPRNHP